MSNLCSKKLFAYLSKSNIQTEKKFYVPSHTYESIIKVNSGYISANPNVRGNTALRVP